MIQKPFAILLCKFKDQKTTRAPKYYEDLFSSTGIGLMNMVDCFKNMSHGQVDVGTSKVSGWYTFDKKRSEYQDDQAGRNNILQLARDAAAAGTPTIPTVDLSHFHSFVVCVPSYVASFGGLGGVMLDDGGVNPGVAAQEMLHTFGLNHSRLNGSLTDYQDKWDVMSGAVDNFWSPSPAYEKVGPLLNAANMDWLGWIDPSRIWSNEGGPSGSTVELRPINRVDLPGYLVARVGQYYVEFRSNEGWDAKIPQPVVLIHRLDSNSANSYLMAGSAGEQGLVKGSVFDIVSPRLRARLEVVAIDAAAHIARINISYVTDLDQNNIAAPLVLLGGAPFDGIGWFIWKGQRIPIPPMGPVFELAKQILALNAADLLEDSRARVLLKEQVLGRVAQLVRAEQQRLTRFHTPSSAKDVAINGISRRLPRRKR